MTASINIINLADLPNNLQALTQPYSAIGATGNISNFEEGKELKNVFRIFGNDVKSVSRQFFAMAIMVAICILPALYAWVNIYANANPYVNTGNIQIAVASRDPGIDLEDGKHVNMADEVSDELRESTSIGWQFPDSPEQAIEGVKSGKYYAAVVFEKNFTYNMYHFEQALLDEDAPLTFYENTKKNAVASKITETAASTLLENINTKYLETVFEIVFKETSNLSEEFEYGDTADNIINQLSQFRDNLDSYDAAIDSFVGNSGKVQKSISNAEKNLATTRSRNQKKVAQAQKDIADAERTVDALKKTIDKRMDALNDSLGRLEKALEALKGVNPVTPEDKASAKEKVQEVREKLEELKGMLPTDGSIEGSGTQIATIDEMLKNLNDMQDQMENMPDKAQELLASIDTMKTLYKDTLKPGFETLINNMNNTVDKLGPFVGTVSSMMDDVNPVLDATSRTVDGMDKSLLQLQKVFRTASDRLGNIIAQVRAAKEDDRVDMLIDLLGGDSDLYSKFFSSLVDVETVEIYSVASYGAAMAPFYSVLAVWVGGVILVSILKTQADRRKFPGLREGQYFFGKFLLFFIMGQIQAAVIVLGDIFLLDCQPVHPWLMWLSAAITSLVFVLLIYALTLSFGDVGKAIVVVIMVVQIAGSSGSYPIEILPEIFSKIYRFFPFPYAINAMREALCGMYRHDYFIYLGELLLFGVLALIIGLVIRKSFIGLNNFVSEKLEETEVL